MPITLYIFGAGGHGSVIQDAAELYDDWIPVFVDDHVESAKVNSDPKLILVTEQWKKLVTEARVSGKGHPQHVIVAVGIGSTREHLSGQLTQEGFLLTTVVHPSAIISESSHVGDGVYIGARAIINPLAKVDDGAIINTAAIVEHHVNVGRFSHAAPNATLLGESSIGERTLIGAGAVVLPEVIIGDDCVVGAGAVVTKDVASGCTVVGTPARVIQHSSKRFDADELSPDQQRDHMTGDGTILA